MTTTNKPIDTLRDGPLKATIWDNSNEKGPFFSVEFTRTYKDSEGNFHDSRSFSGTQLLRLAHLATKAYDRTAELRRAAAGSGDAEEDQDES